MGAAVSIKVAKTASDISGGIRETLPVRVLVMLRAPVRSPEIVCVAPYETGRNGTGREKTKPSPSLLHMARSLEHTADIFGREAHAVPGYNDLGNDVTLVAGKRLPISHGGFKGLVVIAGPLSMADSYR